MGLLDLLLTIILTLTFNLGDVVVINLNIVRIAMAMAAHMSQFIWYRKAFVIFSRYSYVNSFKEYS
jgi:N-acetylglucosaminylphosphatidylinositol deacetylase